MKDGMKNGTESEVKLSSKLWLSAADSMCGMLCGIVTGGGMTYFYTKWMGLSTEYASVVWLLFSIWNAVNDPLFGFISDHTKSKIGRRIPYIRYGAPFYGLIFILMWVPYLFGRSQMAMSIQMLAMLFLFDTLYTAIATALYVMPYEMTVDNKTRASIFIFKIIFGVISLGGPMVLLPLIEPDPKDDPTFFRLVLLGIGVVAAVIIFVSTYFYKELDYVKDEEQPGFFKALAECFKNKPFLIFEVLSFTTQLINTALMQGVLYYFAETKIKMELCYIPMVIGAVAGMFIFKIMTNKLGVKKSLLFLCFEFGLACLMMAFFGNVTFVAVIGFFCAGIGYTGCMFSVPLMNGDVIDYDETRTGLRREGMYAGINSFITKPALSIAQALFLTIWKAYGYDQSLGAGLQSERAKKGLLIAWMIVPAISLIISGISILFYPLDGKEWDEKKKEIIRKHKEKETQYENQSKQNC